MVAERINEMEKSILVLFVAAIIGAGILAGGAGFFGGSHLGPVPSDYVVESPNDCLVLPQGDPLYDQHYANNVNPQNCGAYKTQEEGNIAAAQAEYIHVQADKQFTQNVMTSIGVLFTGGLGLLAVILLIYGLLKGAA